MSPTTCCVTFAFVRPTVAERAGGQEVPVLGEVAPDPARYAEVSTAVAADSAAPARRARMRSCAGTALVELREPRSWARRAARSARRQARRSNWPCRRSSANGHWPRSASCRGARCRRRRRRSEAARGGGRVRPRHARRRWACATSRRRGRTPALFSASLAHRRTGPRSQGGRSARSRIRPGPVQGGRPLAPLAHRARVRARRGARRGRRARRTSRSRRCPGEAFDGRVTLVGQPGRSGLAHDPGARRAREPRTVLLRPGCRRPCGSSSDGPGECSRRCRPRRCSASATAGASSCPRRGTSSRCAPSAAAAIWAARSRSCPACSAGETVVVEGAFLLKAEAEKARGRGRRP